MYNSEALTCTYMEPSPFPLDDDILTYSVTITPDHHVYT